MRIDLIFNNCKLINLLEEREQAINNYDLPIGCCSRICPPRKIEEVENKIHKRKHDLYHTDIVGAFIIFKDYESA